MEEIENEADAIQALGLGGEVAEGEAALPEGEPDAPPGGAPTGDRLAQPAAGGGPV